MRRWGPLEVFASNSVSWRMRHVRLQQCLWHSCMQWGWPSIRAGERLARYHPYWVLSFKWGTRGVTIHWNRSNLDRTVW